MKVTIYELLGMVKDGNIPKRIIYDKYVYQWNNMIENYEREIDMDTTLNWDYIAINCLNEPVEILEEEKKIPEKINIKFWSDEEYTPEQRINVCMTYIDEIIDYLDYLKSKGE